MKGCILFSILAIGMVLNVHGQQNHLTEKDQAQNAVIGLFEALAELDVAKAKSFCAPGVTILESGMVWNFDSLALRITTRKAKSADFKRVNNLQFLETKLEGNIAWLYYLNQAAISYAGKTVSVKWLESAVLKKEDNAWKISLLHSTELERMAD